jgi:tetratricopeptide (TPR) repeat protein
MSIFRLTTLVSAMLVVLSMAGHSFVPLQTNLGNLSVVRALHASREPAIESFDRLDKATPYLKGVIAYRRGNFSEARFYFQNSLATHTDLARHYTLESAFAQRDWQETLKAIDPSRPNERIFLVKVLAEYGNDMDPDLYEQYMNIIRSDPLLAAAYLHHLLSKNLFDEVIQYGSSLSHSGESIQVQLMVGRAYFYKKDYRNAVEIFQKVYKQQPTLDNTVWLGKALFNNGQFEEGIQYLEMILQQPSGQRYIPYLVDLGVAYAAIGRCLSAQQILNEATETDRIGAYRSLLESAKYTVSVRCKE